MLPDTLREVGNSGAGGLRCLFSRPGVACVDAEGRIEFASDRWSELVGRAGEEVAGSAWFDCAAQVARARLEEAWRNAVALRAPLRTGFPLTRADGSLEELCVELAPCSDTLRGVGPGRWLATLVGSSERERTEEEELFLQLTHHIREVLWLTDWRTRQVLFVSPAYEATWKKSCQSLHDDARSWADPIHPEDKARVVEAFQRDAERGLYEVQYRILWPDGSVRWIYDRAFPIRDATGAVVRMAGISEDVTERMRAERELEDRVRERTESLGQTFAQLEREITERKQVEQELRESEGRFRQLAENIREVFWLSRADSTGVLYVSPAYQRVWGRTPESLYAKPTDWQDAIVAEDRERVREAWENDVRRGAYDVQYRIRRPDGTLRWIHDRGFVVPGGDPSSERVAGFALDITVQKEAQLEMAAYQEQLRSLAAELVLAEERERRRLATDLHDGLNQIITLARLKLGALRRGAGELAEGLRQGLREVEELIEQANRSARSLTFQLSPPVLHDLGLLPAVEWLAEDVQKSYELEVEVRCEGPAPVLDEEERTLLFRAVRELLINVAKHARASRAEVRIRHLDEILEVRVQDDGRSFSLDDACTKGFGLFSIHERLSHLGGNMIIDSRPGLGTTVVLHCPAGPSTDQRRGSSAREGAGL